MISFVVNTNTGEGAGLRYILIELISTLKGRLQILEDNQGWKIYTPDLLILSKTIIAILIISNAEILATVLNEYPKAV